VFFVAGQVKDALTAPVAALQDSYMFVIAVMQYLIVMKMLLPIY